MSDWRERSVLGRHFVEEGVELLHALERADTAQEDAHERRPHRLDAILLIKDRLILDYADDIVHQLKIDVGQEETLLHALLQEAAVTTASSES